MAQLVDMAGLLARAGDELERLADEVERLHRLVEPAARRGGLGAQAIEDAQAIDYLQQHLTALSAVLRVAAAEDTLAGGVPAEPLAASIPLADLAHRLLGRPLPAAPALAPADLDLF